MNIGNLISPKHERKKKKSNQQNKFRPERERKLVFARTKIRFKISLRLPHAYLLEFVLIAQVKGDVKERKKAVDKLEKGHLGDEMIFVLRLQPIVLCR